MLYDLTLVTMSYQGIIDISIIPWSYMVHTLIISTICLLIAENEASVVDVVIRAKIRLVFNSGCNTDYEDQTTSAYLQLRQQFATSVCTTYLHVFLLLKCSAVTEHWLLFLFV